MHGIGGNKRYQSGNKLREEWGNKKRTTIHAVTPNRIQWHHLE